MTQSKSTKIYKKHVESIINEVILKIDKLELDEEINKKIKNALKETKPKRKAPNIPEEKQCNQITKRGVKCVVAKCIVNKCWAHMDKEERNTYQKLNKKELILSDSL